MGWAAITGYKLYTGAPDVEPILDAFVNFNLKALLKDLPLIIAGAGSKFLFFKNLTFVVFTDLLIVAIFDAADDELTASETGNVEEDKKALMKEWHRICPPPSKRKKKKKK